jgi:hypothetical protein
MLAAGQSFNIPEEKHIAHIGVISFFFFVFMIIYSVSIVALTRSSHHS